MENWTKLIEVLLTGTVGAIIGDFARWLMKRRDASSPQAVRATDQVILEKALVSLGDTKDELVKDITRSRARVTELEDQGRERETYWQTRWDVREVYWQKKESEMRTEIDTMRERMVQLITELDTLRRKCLPAAEGK